MGRGGYLCPCRLRRRAQQLRRFVWWLRADERPESTKNTPDKTGAMATLRVSRLASLARMACSSAYTTPPPLR